ncbi:sulfurtransferase [Myroides albus]|uniref:Sulfurtransferase n=1 Tax=Myroides albus TaxID=2562892 RepID=A0A6I3LR66_9FLAO|nr:sulfurtransferase [Myroides albus]MTG99171.1 sulfurtransferase [Myroides albus]UVD81271.1 sulfurtransferase [Myroides albus]
MKPIIEQDELFMLIQKQSSNLIIVDASNHKQARENYEKQHIQGAIFVDANEQLATIGDVAAMGGRHPLPSVEKFAKVLQELGISKRSHVVIYDDKYGGNSAARFWWMLKAVGHDNVQVLNGGYQSAVLSKLPMSNQVTVHKPTEEYAVTSWELPIAEIKELVGNSQSEDYLVIDVREPNRYKGISEPIDEVAGHIPGAVNIPFMSNLDENGCFLPSDMLKAKYKELLENFDTDKTIVHCGSGITACHTLLAIASAGLPIPKLYVGSWSEWSRSENPIATDK